jgi:hypothetical protein
MLGTANLILPSHGSARQYMHETVCISCTDHLASSVLQTYVHLYRRYDWTVDTHRLDTITENVLKMILQNEHELILEKSNITTN